MKKLRKTNNNVVPFKNKQQAHAARIAEVTRARKTNQPRERSNPKWEYTTKDGKVKRIRRYALQYTLTDYRVTNKHLLTTYEVAKRSKRPYNWHTPAYARARQVDYIKKVHYTLRKRDHQIQDAVATAAAQGWFPTDPKTVNRFYACVATLLTADPTDTDTAREAYIPVFTRPVTPAHVAELGALAPYRQNWWHPKFRRFLVAPPPRDYFEELARNPDAWQKHADPVALRAYAAGDRAARADATRAAYATLYALTRLTVNGDHATTLALLATTRQRRTFETLTKWVRQHYGDTFDQQTEGTKPVTVEITVHNTPRTAYAWRTVIDPETRKWMATVTTGLRARYRLTTTPTVIVAGTHYTRNDRSHVSIAIRFYARNEQEAQRARTAATKFAAYTANRLQRRGHRVTYQEARTVPGSTRLPFTLPLYTFSPYKDGHPAALIHYTHQRPAVLYISNHPTVYHTYNATATNPGKSIPVWTGPSTRVRARTRVNPYAVDNCVVTEPAVEEEGCKVVGFHGGGGGSPRYLRC